MQREFMIFFAFSYFLNANMYFPFLAYFPLSFFLPVVVKIIWQVSFSKIELNVNFNCIFVSNFYAK